MTKNKKLCLNHKANRPQPAQITIFEDLKVMLQKLKFLEVAMFWLQGFGDLGMTKNKKGSIFKSSFKEIYP